MLVFGGCTNRCWFCTPTNPAAIFLFHLRSRMLIEQVVWHSNIYSDGIAEDRILQSKHMPFGISRDLLTFCCWTCWHWLVFFSPTKITTRENPWSSWWITRSSTGHWAPKGKKNISQDQAWKSATYRWFDIFLRMDPATWLLLNLRTSCIFRDFFWGKL